jgi:hypothetical protein
LDSLPGPGLSPDGDDDQCYWYRVAAAAAAAEAAAAEAQQSSDDYDREDDDEDIMSSIHRLGYKLPPPPPPPVRVRQPSTYLDTSRLPMKYPPTHILLKAGYTVTPQGSTWIQRDTGKRLPPPGEYFARVLLAKAAVGKADTGAPPPTPKAPDDRSPPTAAASKPFLHTMPKWFGEQHGFRDWENIVANDSCC